MVGSCRRAQQAPKPPNRDNRRHSDTTRDKDAGVPMAILGVSQVQQVETPAKG